MRRLLSIIVLSALWALTAGPALGAGPERAPNETFVADFAAGETCPFAVRWAGVRASGQTLTFPAGPDGDQSLRILGAATIDVINLETGASITVHVGGRQNLIFHADGTIDAVITGRVLAAYFPTDLGGPAMTLFIGRLHDTVTSDFTLVAHAFRGSEIDLCAALSD